MAIQHFILLATVIVQAMAYSSEAPIQACKSLRPNHVDEHDKTKPILLKTEANPFTVTADPARFKAGDKVKITVTSSKGHHIRGIMVQAHEQNKIVGRFEVDRQYQKYMKTIKCDQADNTLSHVKIAEPYPQKLQFTWVAPTGSKAVDFYGTIAHDHDNFWSMPKLSIKSL